ncbi:hypothetical protein SERLA73DRAFT_109679 [Serpula lacrymans var. lacrymans S7.3]|uniref:Uncharacterized protein n=1 Tax=Serpula lacrymans var. lacrymans (strain S7.3) TaxID=936435 RepID=F8PZG5_SERL3|nr:hypothetical protein SERLA73DRAFT_109679 [Serpula lacrymans var. lacrymans S7.3]
MTAPFTMSICRLLSVLLVVFFTSIASNAAVVRDTPAGTISSPADDTTIAPGASFDFHYNTRADYGVSSYNFTVWLWSNVSLTMASPGQLATGHYFGRFSEENYPGTNNPVPAQLVMPDLAISPGGFGAGANGTNAIFYIVVIEEWASGEVSLIGLLL